MSGGAKAGDGGTLTSDEEPTIGLDRGPAEASPRPGDVIGRYVVLGVIGRGGMGTVLRARDPTLEREVALKVVRAQRLGSTTRARMLREARAMARLSHPNVVALYDAEDVDGRIVIVMEYVDGDTLQVWAEATRPTAREIVACYREAGRGLAAAHDQGLLHRDFKPANVLVARSGAVKVTDFGLARLVAGLDSTALEHEAPPGVAELGPGDSLSAPLTRDDVVVGTPRYMAPEQHRGAALTAAVDQYAFCAALWQALTGELPFSAESYAGLLVEKEAGPPTWPAGTKLPRGVVAALQRGLQPNPARRWPDMHALLAALERRTRRTWSLVGAGVVALVLVGAAAALAYRGERCTGAEAQLHGVWDDARRDAARTAVLGGAGAWAEEVWARTEPKLDAYAEQWVALHRAACEAAGGRARGDEALDLQMACLRRGKDELAAVTTVLAGADGDVVLRADELVGELRPLARCDDLAELRRGVDPPSAADEATVTAIRVSLANARAERRAGRYALAKEHVEAAKQRLPEVDYDPVRTEVMAMEGDVLAWIGELEEAADLLEDAFRSASAQQQTDVMQWTATRLAFVLGAQLARTDEGLRYGEIALSLTDDPLRRAAAESNIGSILVEQGKYAEAEVRMRRALATRLELQGPDALEVAVDLQRLAAVHLQAAQYDEAIDDQQRSLAILEKTLGPAHPRVGTSRTNLGTSYMRQGRYDDAERELRKARDLLEAALGPGHASTTSAAGNLGMLLFAKGQHAEAEALVRQVVESKERSLGPDHPDVALGRGNLGIIVASSGRNEDAEPIYRQALDAQERTLGAEHTEVARTVHNLAITLQALGRLDEAEALFRRSVGIRERVLSPDHADLATSRTQLARILVDRGRAAEALPIAKQAWIRRNRDGVPPEQKADTGFVLARSLWETSDDPATRDEARRLAQEALQRYGGAVGDHEQDMATIREWLADTVKASPRDPAARTPD